MNLLSNLIKYTTNNLVPYHNDCVDTYFFGNSIVGASGHPNGEWTFAIGPDYTSPNYISSENIYLLVNNQQHELDFKMKRIRNTGIFFGECELNDINIFLWDFAPFDLSATLRLIYVDCNGDVPANAIRICAEIIPFECNSNSNNNQLHIHKDTTQFCFGNRETLNWADRYCDVFFDGNESKHSTVNDEKHVLITALDSNSCACLVHSCYYNEPCYIENDSIQLLADTITQWENWINSGNMPQISNQRDADALESLLLCVKMQQNRDGGAIAGIRKYANSYIRDTHGCTRILLATGHYGEVRKLLRNIHTRWICSGFIPNWWSMGSDSFIGHSFNNDVSEITAYYIFMARDYLSHTNDRELISEILPSLEWAANAQLDWLKSHDYTMDFNGDETEQYCCNKDGEEYGFFVHPEYPWNHKALSFSSMCAALCSLEWYASYAGIDWTSDLTILRNKIDEVFLNKKDGLHVWHANPSKDGYTHHKGHLTNFLLMPLWIGAKLNNNAELTNAAGVPTFLREDGFLPNCPQIMPGFCGHTMGIFLYDMIMLAQNTNENVVASKALDHAGKALRTILDSNLLSMYGTVSEFYGPSCVPNGHNCRGFEGGIIGEALIKLWEHI